MYVACVHVHVLSEGEKGTDRDTDALEDDKYIT